MCGVSGAGKAWGNVVQGFGTRVLSEPPDRHLGNMTDAPTLQVYVLAQAWAQHVIHQNLRVQTWWRLLCMLYRTLVIGVAWSCELQPYSDYFSDHFNLGLKVKGNSS